jgi:hypothetical protein
VAWAQQYIKDIHLYRLDPKRFVPDNSTMANGALPSTGIPYVIVNGTIIVKDSKVLKGVYPAGRSGCR